MYSERPNVGLKVACPFHIYDIYLLPCTYLTFFTYYPLLVSKDLAGMDGALFGSLNWQE